MPGFVDKILRRKRVLTSPARAAGHSAKGQKRAYQRTKLSGPDFQRWAGNKTKELILSDEVLADRGRALKFLCETVCRYYPVASAAVWTWKNLCSTRQKVKYIGGSDLERKKAKEIISDLDARISPFSYVQGGGMDMLVNQLFHYLFTYGRFAGNLHLSRDLSEVQMFEILDPFRIRFTKKDRKAYIETEDHLWQEANKNTFFYYALDMDWVNPYGEAMLEAAWSLMEMAQDMLDDLSRSSANVGVPRLHIKINQPEKMEGEDDEEYVQRANSYFDAYVENFADIAPDDNFYSWNDISIGTVGGHPGASGFVWQLNRQIFDEEIIAGFHLFPWIVGKSSQTTKNWVRSQFDLIMSQTESVQKVGKRFAEWIRGVELALKGVHNVRVHQQFEPVRDPARKDMAVASRFEIANVEAKIKDGFISVDDGARELGYNQAHDKERFPFNKGIEDTGVSLSNGEEVEEFREDIEEIKEKIDNLAQRKESE